MAAKDSDHDTSTTTRWCCGVAATVVRSESEREMRVREKSESDIWKEKGGAVAGGAAAMVRLLCWWMREWEWERWEWDLTGERGSDGARWHAAQQQRKADEREWVRVRVRERWELKREWDLKMKQIWVI